MAAISFGFVYLHPLADGNGRIHRFLVNHLLAADRVVPAGIIVPVSATIAGNVRARAEYDHVLEVVSKTEDARHAWQYLDLSEHTRYLSSVLRQTVEHEMAEEALILRHHENARAAIKNVVEMPDHEADRIIRSLKEGNWAVSGKLRKALPQIFEEGGALYGRHARLIAAVRTAFEEKVSADRFDSEP